jgi:hypothetical protein
MMAAEEAISGRSREGQVRRTLVILGAALPLAACGWFGSHKDDQAATASGPTTPSDQVLQKDCSDETWKQQNLGLWYSVCRQSMKW